MIMFHECFAAATCILGECRQPIVPRSPGTVVRGSGVDARSWTDRFMVRRGYSGTVIYDGTVVYRRRGKFVCRPRRFTVYYVGGLMAWVLVSATAAEH